MLFDKHQDKLQSKLCPRGACRLSAQLLLRKPCSNDIQVLKACNSPDVNIEPTRKLQLHVRR